MLLVALDARSVADSTGTRLGRVLGLYAMFAVVVLAANGVVSDLRWVVGGFDGSVPFGDPTWGASFAALQLIAYLDPILPELAFVFLFSWALRLLLPLYLPPIRRLAGQTPGKAETPTEVSLWKSRRTSLAMLGFAIAIAVFVGAYPYLRAVNPRSVLIGVDARHCYSQFLNTQSTGGICGNVNECRVERYGAFLMLQGPGHVAGSTTAVFQLELILLSSLLVVSSYALVLEGTGDGFLAGVSALTAAVSPEVVAGINAGFVANWLAVSVALLFFASLLRGLRKRRLRFVGASIVLFVLLLVVHPWTWAVTLGVLSAFLVMSILESAWSHQLRSKGLEVLLLTSIIFVALVVDAARSLFPSGSGLELALATIFPALSIPNISVVLTDLRSTFVMFLLGGWRTPSGSLPGAFGVLSIRRLRDNFGRLLSTWLAAISLGVVLLGPSPADRLQARLLFDAPFPILAALGLVAVVRIVMASLEAGSKKDT